MELIVAKVPPQMLLVGFGGNPPVLEIALRDLW